MKKLMYFVIAVAVLTGLNTAVVADFDPEEILTSMDEFLIHQMEVFDSVRPPGQPPLIQSYAWDPDVPFPPDDLNPCVDVPCAPAPHWQLVYRGDIYDQSLAVCYFVSRSKSDPNYLNRARRLLDAGIFLEERDPYGDGRLRAAYWANNLLSPSATEPSIMDPDAGTGNIAWFGIALTRFCDMAEKTDYLDAATRKYYLDIAKEKANWILDHCTDSAPCGFTGGYGGWGQVPFNWKSTEHNIDVYVLARNLCELDGDPKWCEMAERAACFVQGMFVDDNGPCGHYWTGTTNDGITPNQSPIPADAQSWTALARWNGVKIDTDERAECAMRWLLENLKDGCESDIFCPLMDGTGLLPICLPDDGVKFSDVGKNMQCEVTAGAAMALMWLGEEREQAEAFVELLDWIRLNACRPDDGIEDGIGIVATPCPEGAWTGWEGAWYYNLLHVASSAWTGLAVMVMEGDQTANPLMPSLPIEANVHIVPRVINRNNRLKRVMAIVRLPEGISKDDVIRESFELYAGGLDSEPIGAILERVIGRGNMTRVFALFDKAEVMNAVEGVGSVELTVVGKLESGQYIQGSDTVRIVQPRRRRPHWQAGRRRR